jgi:hypothetical protein
MSTSKTTKSKTKTADDVLSSLPACPPEGSTRTQYEKYLLSLRAPAGKFERGLGWLSFLQGMALERFMSSPKCKRGDYKRILEKVGLKPGTAYNVRRIYRAFKDKQDEARQKGYTEMLQELGLANKKDPTDKEEKPPKVDDAPEETETDEGRPPILGALESITLQLRDYEGDEGEETINKLNASHRKEMQEELKRIRDTAAALLKAYKTETPVLRKAG